MRIMITGGGTGGHTSPAVAIVQELRRRDPQLIVQWVGKKDAIEDRVAKSNAIPFRAVSAAGWPRKRTPKRLLVAVKMAWGLLQSYIYIQRFHPQAVIGVGGYVSLPLGFAATLTKTPLYLHEQNKRLGMANRILSKKVAHLFLGYPDTLGDYPKDRATHVGNPVRAGFTKPVPRNEACETLGLNPDQPVILISGGSQGARTLNSAIKELLPELKPDGPQLIWMTGKSEYNECRTSAEKSNAHIEVFAFIDDMVSAMTAADLIITRAGASTTAELSLLGKPAILIPYPHATDNHQLRNAEAFVEANAARLIEDHDCNGETLLQCITELLQSPATLNAMAEATKGLAKPLAVETMVDTIVADLFSEGTK